MKRYCPETLGDSIPDLTELSQCELQHWLTCFVLEVRKEDSSEFVPNMLQHICCTTWGETDSIPLTFFFSDSNFKATLDAKMKRMQSAGIWSKTRHCQVEVLMEDEKLLRQKGLLGDATSQTLVDDTTVYMNSLYCFAKWQRIQTIEVYSLRS